MVQGRARPPLQPRRQDPQEAWTAYNIGEYQKTLRLIQLLAGDGNPRAQVMLGRCYENGLGVPQDLAVAAQWYQLAAEQNYSEAQVLLAYCYEVGAGVPKDPRAVVTLMTRAAKSGNAEAQFNLALYYSQGMYQTAKDQKESFRWAKLSADQGYAQAERLSWAPAMNTASACRPTRRKPRSGTTRPRAGAFAKEGNVFNRVREYPMP